MLQRVVAGGCATAGIWLLAGPGWALLALGALMWVCAPRGRGAGLPAWGQVRATAAAAARRVAVMPRRAVAVVSMGAGVAGVPSGMALAFGAGAAVLAAGVMLVGVSMLTGWNA